MHCATCALRAAGRSLTPGLAGRPAHLLPLTIAESLTAAPPQDLRGFLVLRQHYTPAQVVQFNAGVDELQAIPLEFEAYRGAHLQDAILNLPLISVCFLGVCLQNDETG